MRKKLVKLLFHMLCAAAIVAGLCAAVTALQLDGLTLEDGTLPPVAYQLEVIYEPVKCAKIEEINFGPGGDFAILHTRPTGIAGEFSIEDIRYISYYNAAGNQQFSLRLEENAGCEIKADGYASLCVPLPETDRTRPADPRNKDLPPSQRDQYRGIIPQMECQRTRPGPRWVGVSIRWPSNHQGEGRAAPSHIDLRQQLGGSCLWG